MDGFKDSTKTCWVKGYAKGGSVRGAAKVSKVMREFKAGDLHSGSKAGPKVKNRKQAIAIAMNETKPVKKAMGGEVIDAVEIIPERRRRDGADNPDFMPKAMRAQEEQGMLQRAAKGVPSYSKKPMLGR